MADAQDMNSEALEAATQEQMAKFDEALEEQQALSSGCVGYRMIRVACCAANSGTRRCRDSERVRNLMNRFVGNPLSGRAAPP